MSFALADHWVWDFWIADDGETFHLFYLHAPHSLVDSNLRHRNARIGHATSPDLVNWTAHGLAFPAGAPGAFDDTATWTGSVVRGHDGRWRMYYTGSHFLSPDSNANIETVGMLVSDDLFTWTKLPGPVCRADARWYETLGTSSWPEEAWRDPWVFPAIDGKTWHMLVTARANQGDDMQRGVIGHATSSDMENWTVQPPLSSIGAGFAHLEVTQIVEIEGQTYVLFCCDTPRLSGRLAGQMGGNWTFPAPSDLGPFDPSQATLLTSQRYYAGRLVKDRKGNWGLMAFDSGPDGPFRGLITDPMPVEVDKTTGHLVLANGEKR